MFFHALHDGAQILTIWLKMAKSIIFVNFWTLLAAKVLDIEQICKDTTDRKSIQEYPYQMG